MSHLPRPAAHDYYLKSIFDDIEGPDSANSAPLAHTPPSQAPQPTKKEGTTANGVINGVAPPKRKAESGSDRARNKFPCKDNASSVGGKPTSTAPSSGPPVRKEPYCGTAMAPTSSKLLSRAPLNAATPSKPNAASSAPSADSAAPAKGPTKGSYAEILARGKAGQPKDVMKIQNKKASEPILARGRDKKRWFNRARPGSGEREIRSVGEGGDSGIVRKRPEYKGSARASSAAPPSKPARPAYSGTARQNSGPIASRNRPRFPQGKTEKVRYAGYACWGDEDDDEGDESDDLNDGDLESEASSDMEANIFDVDQEEELSTRAAKKEDAEELAKLNEHERQKRLRKPMSENMAAKKRNEKRVL